MAVTGNEYVRLSQLKMLSDGLASESGPAFIEVGSPQETLAAFDYDSFAIWEVNGCFLPIVSLWNTGDTTYSICNSDDCYEIAIVGYSVSVTSSIYGLIASADFGPGNYDFSTDVTWRFFVPKWLGDA